MDYNQIPSIPTINDVGAVAFVGDAGFGRSDVLYLYESGELRAVDEPIQLDGELGLPSLNELGEIAYVRQESENEYRLVLFRDGASHPFDVDGVIESRVSLNNAGAIAFLGLDQTGHVGVRLWHQNSAIDVLGYTDHIFGKQVKAIEPWDLNERNQLALHVKFTDDAEAVILATLVPEPALRAVIMGLVWTAGSATRRRRGGHG
jgi:hypothetical protein